MAFEQKQNSGTFWPSKKESKTDWNGKINIMGIDYVIFGYNKQVKVKGSEVDIIELSIMVDKNNVPTPPKPVGDLPF